VSEAIAKPDGQLADARLLTGLVAEWGELLEILSEHHGLTVVIADPWCGTTPLLREAVRETAARAVLVDARACADAGDLALAIADAAVAEHAPEARAWWLLAAPPSSTAGLRLWRALREQQIDVESLRRPSGPGDKLLAEAIELLVTLAPDSPALVIDHLGGMLAPMRAGERLVILDVLRSARQRHERLDMLLVDHPRGPVATALADESHPLYRAGRPLRFRRPSPDRIVGDLAITRPVTGVAVDLLRAAAELAAGIPELTWKVIDFAPAGADDRARALAGWNALQHAAEGSVRREWDLLRRVHPSAQAVVAALSLGLKPHAVVPAASKSVNDALNRLRDSGIAWQPEKQRWALTDPLLAAYARRNPPPWSRRRSTSARLADARAPT